MCMLASLLFGISYLAIPNTLDEWISLYKSYHYPMCKVTLFLC